MIRTLVIFARKPIRGQVKRRLAKDIGHTAATRFYRNCLRRTVARLADRRWRMEVSLTPDGARMPGCWDVRPQGSGDLGERMARALDLAGHTLVIGSDIPGLTRQHIGRAFNRLKAAPVVLGPATDGGYWAIGQRARGRLKLAPIRWSGPHALADTIQALGKKHYALADMMQDVDDGAALAGLGFR